MQYTLYNIYFYILVSYYKFNIVDILPIFNIVKYSYPLISQYIVQYSCRYSFSNVIIT